MPRHLTKFYPLSAQPDASLLFPTGKREMWRTKGCREREKKERWDTSDRARWSVSDGGVRSGCTSQNIIKKRPLVWLGPCCLVETADCFTQSDWHSDLCGGGWWRCLGTIQLNQTQQRRRVHYFTSVGAFFLTERCVSWCKCWITVSVQGNSILTQIIPDRGGIRLDGATAPPVGQTTHNNRTAGA